MYQYRKNVNTIFELKLKQLPAGSTQFILPAGSSCFTNCLLSCFFRITEGTIKLSVTNNDRVALIAGLNPKFKSNILVFIKWFISVSLHVSTKHTFLTIDHWHTGAQSNQSPPIFPLHAIIADNACYLVLLWMLAPQS